MSRKIEYWYKRIPNEHQGDFNNLARFKISLSKIKNKKDMLIIKSMLNLKVNDIFNNIAQYDISSAKDYLKLSIDKTILQLSSVSEISENDLNDAINRITLEEMFEVAIKEKELYHIQKLKELEKNGLDITIKKAKTSSTVSQYMAIRGYLFKCFNKDTDIKSITYQDIQKLQLFLIENEVSNGSNNLYIQQLKSIYRKYVKQGIINTNPIQIEYLPVSKSPKMFTNEEIPEVSKILTKEEHLLFNTLLFSGMRLEELMTIRIKNISNGVFYAIDAKSNKSKDIPIHNDIKENIADLMKNRDMEDYLFFNNGNKTRLTGIRSNINLKLKIAMDKTLHKTRATFRTFLENTEWKDSFINELMGHSQKGMGNRSYVVNRNIDIKRKIIDSIDYEIL